MSPVLWGVKALALRAFLMSAGSERRGSQSCREPPVPMRPKGGAAGSPRASSGRLAARGRCPTLHLGSLFPSSAEGVRNVSRNASCCAWQRVSPRSISCDSCQLDSFLASSLNLDPESLLLLGVTTSYRERLAPSQAVPRVWRPQSRVGKGCTLSLPAPCQWRPAQEPS